jgi:hypothetical protein
MAKITVEEAHVLTLIEELAKLRARLAQYEQTPTVQDALQKSAEAALKPTPLTKAVRKEIFTGTEKKAARGAAPTADAKREALLELHKAKGLRPETFRG